jgi:hypothetical protein
MSKGAWRWWRRRSARGGAAKETAPGWGRRFFFRVSRRGKRGSSEREGASARARRCPSSPRRGSRPRHRRCRRRARGTWQPARGMRRDERRGEESIKDGKKKQKRTNKAGGVQEVSRRGRGRERGGGARWRRTKGLRRSPTLKPSATTGQRASSASNRAACVRCLMVGRRSVNGQEERERARKVGRGWGIFYVGVRFALFRRCGPRVRGEQWRCGPRVVWRLGDGALHTSG